MKCTKKDCSKEAEYIVDGQSICKEHRKENPKEPEEEPTAGEKMIGGF